MAFRLYTTWYREWHARRRGELVACLAANCQTFDAVTVLSENCPRPVEFAGLWFEGFQRQKYADLLALAAKADPDDIVILANTDIFFAPPGECRNRETLELIGQSIQPGEVYALSRWDILGESNYKLFDKAASQDAWVFRGPPQPNLGGDYFFGVPGVDNRFANELDAAGYRVLNPSRDIRSYHLHLSQHRPGNTAANRVSGPYLFVSPHKLGEAPRYHRPKTISKNASQV